MERVVVAREPAIGNFDGRNLSRTDVPITRGPRLAAGDGSAATVKSTERFFALASTADEPAVGAASVGTLAFQPALAA